MTLYNTISQEVNTAPFDDFDIFYLANTFEIPQLRREVHHAEVMAKVDEIWQGTPYADANPFPWAAYAEAGREAIKAIQEHNRELPQKSAKASSHIDTEAIKSRNDIVALVESYTQLRKSGHNRFAGRCPLHEDNHPSLTVYADQQTWHCFQCDKGGDIFDFIMATNSVDFKRAAAILGGN